MAECASLFRPTLVLAERAWGVGRKSVAHSAACLASAIAAAEGFEDGGMRFAFPPYDGYGDGSVL